MLMSPQLPAMCLPLFSAASCLAGFTHLQQAQTVRWGHWLMSHAAAWQRDDMRLRDLLPRVATLPLGSGALAGMVVGGVQVLEVCSSSLAHHTCIIHRVFVTCMHTLKLRGCWM
jgi:fumarate hydratase class II